MSVLNYLQEQFFHADRVSNLSTARKPVYIEIFKNPSPRELITLKKQYRYIRMGMLDGDIYAWRGNILHDNAIDIINDKTGKNDYWDYKMMYDPDRWSEMEAYSGRLGQDDKALSQLYRIFPRLEQIIYADDDGVISTKEDFLQKSKN